MSAPANPRQSTIYQAEAFAPDRQAVSAEHQPQNRVFDDFDELIASELAAIKQEAPAVSPFAAEEVVGEGPAEDEWQDYAAAPGQEDIDHAAGYAPEDFPEGEQVFRPTPAVAARGRLGSSALVGAGLGAIALMVVAGGAYVLLGGGSGVVGDGSVLIVKADPNPVKVKPENPGGREIPNQNKVVYSRVASSDAIVTPEQKQLVNTSETPIALPTGQDDSLSNLPGVELGVTPANAAETAKTADAVSAASPIAVLSPRQAKTYSVRPDGTLVVANAQDNVDAPRGPLIEAASKPVNLDPSTDPAVMPTGEAKQGEGAAAPAAATQTAGTDLMPIGTPAPNVPIPTLRPSPSGSGASMVMASATVPTTPAATDRIQTAALAAQPQTPAAGSTPAPAPTAQIPTPDGYYVQISSQPSREAAEASQRNLSRRYSSVIAGHDVVIQSADIPGKGTYYRVRVPVGSRGEGNTLCGDLKSAGGSCFVAR
ncbi:SPOR domain-containing protein [Jiella sp. MQZ9-1]|uniref:SPOR domain-containing protein n=1 Tax=Jiella flava TaxID=2816857 RepID=A0A939FXX0_9HYPH|nr:SPOR domain-containing protein [Jiella flava]MBO0662776.1 SPOR domain-containing protein [Jiella flava]MCD2471197.1 SPOR domain-containing protein [Jiella flava]